MNYNGFKKIRMYGWCLWLCRDLSQNQALDLATQGDDVQGRRGDLTKVASSVFANVFKCRLFLKGKPSDLYLKLYLHRSRWDFVKHLFRSSRAMRDFKASLMLKSHGFGTPRIVALGQRRIGPCCVKNFMITDELKDTQPVNQLAAHAGRESQAQRKEFINSFGRTIGRMHNAGIFHGDLRLGNILAENGSDGWQFFFVDNERTKKYSRIPAKLRRKNLVQLNMIGSHVSDRDRLRFFSAYMAQNASMRSKRKELLSAVMKKTAKRKSGRLAKIV